MVMVLDTVGLPADDVALILAIDWLLDRQVLKEWRALLEFCPTYLAKRCSVL